MSRFDNVPVGGGQLPPSASNPAPTFTTAPSISGTAVVGETLRASDGVVSNGRPTAGQWMRGSEAVPFEQGPSYTLTLADLGKAVAYRVIAAGAGGTVTAMSASTSPVTAPIAIAPTPTPSPTPTPTPTAPAFTVQPSISGTPQVGQTLTGMDGTISNGTVVSRRWLLGGAVVSTAQAYLATTTGSLVYEVTATGAGGTIVATSAAVTIGAAAAAYTIFAGSPIGTVLGAAVSGSQSQLGYHRAGDPVLVVSGGQLVTGAFL